MKNFSFNRQISLDEFGKMFTVYGSNEKFDIVFIKDTGHKESWTVSQNDNKTFNTEGMYDQDFRVVEFIDKTNTLDKIQVEVFK